MSKVNSVCGFLYHPASNTVLLRQKSDSEKTPKEMSGLCFPINEVSPNEKNHCILFQKKAKVLWDLTIKDVLPVYTYFDDVEKKNVFVYYAILRQKKDFPDKNNSSFVWASLKQVAKLKLAKRMEHDLIISQRVIDSALRKKRGEQYLE